MISKELYKEIAAQWKQRIYQKYERLETRYPLLLKEIGVFKDKHVLEIGANAGMAAMEIAKVAKQYTGVEVAQGYYEQSLITKKYIDNKNVSFNKCSVKSYVKRMLSGTFKDKPNAAYLSYVLYHFEDKEVEMFKEHILPLLDVIIVQSRFSKRNIKGRRKHNSYGFWHPDKVKKYLESAEFETKLIWHKAKKFHLIIGTKPKYQSKDIPTPKEVLLKTTKPEKESGKKFAENVIVGLIKSDAARKKLVKDAEENLQRAAVLPKDLKAEPPKKRKAKTGPTEAEEIVTREGNTVKVKKARNPNANKREG